MYVGDLHMSVVQQAPLCLLIEVTFITHIMLMTCNGFISVSPDHLDAVIICCLSVMCGLLTHTILMVIFQVNLC